MASFKQVPGPDNPASAQRFSVIAQKIRGLPVTGQLAIALIIIGLASMPLGWISHSVPRVEPLPLAESFTGDRFEKSDWQPHGIYAAGELPPRYHSLEYRGSFVTGDAFVGAQISGWYGAKPRVAVMVAGFPTFPPNQLEIEVRRTGQQNLSIPFKGENPRESWTRWVVSLPEDAEAFRIRGYDGTTSWGGWLCFTEPFAPSIANTIDFWMVGQTFGTVALALVLILGPGIVWRAWRRTSLLSLIWVGPLWLALGGTACWALGGSFAPTWVALAWVIGTLLGLIWLSLRLPIWQSWSTTELRVIALVPICVLGAASKAAFSGGPPGELYHGRISRTLEIGDRGDSRISFHTVQLVANHLSPNEPEGAKFFAPWHFSARGPLAGLAAVPVVLALGNHPPLAQPEQPWVPFDPQGFAAYRIVLMTLAALSLIALTALVKRIAGEQRAWIAAALLALSPFFWHEVYFTWPKLITATWVLGAFQLLLDGHAIRSAFFLGGAYLWHPLALLSTPVFNIWLLGETRPPLYRRFVRSFLFGLAVVGVMGAWLLINGQNSSQSGFLDYFRAADGVHAPADVWWANRWTSFLNTCVPFHVLWCCAGNPAFNAINSLSSDVVHFFFQYWTAAPFAVGIETWAVLLMAFFRGIARHPRVAALTLIAPTLLFIAYMGIVSTGIMRDGGHVIFLTGWAFLVWAAGDKVPAWVLGNGFSLVRAIEVLAMMFVPALVTASPALSDDWLLNDVFWLLVAAASLAVMTWQISRDRGDSMNQPSAYSKDAA